MNLEINPYPVEVALVTSDFKAVTNLVPESKDSLKLFENLTNEQCMNNLIFQLKVGFVQVQKPRLAIYAAPDWLCDCTLLTSRCQALC